MTNPYFNHTNLLARHTRVRADDVNNLLTGVADGFDLLPTPSQLQNAGLLFAADTGSADSLVVTMPITMTAYNDGAFIIVQVAATNTGAATINVDSLGARAIKTIDGNDPSAGDLTADDYVGLVCDETNTRWILFSFRRSLVTAINASVVAAALSESNAATSASNAATSASSAATSLATLVAMNLLAKSGGTMTGTLGILDTEETVSALSGTTPTIDVTAAQVFTLTTSGNTTFSVSNAPTGKAWCRTITITMGGSHTLAVTSANWGDEGAPSGLTLGDKVKIQLDGIGTTFEAMEVWRDTA